MAALYVAAGINHFIHTAMYREIMPPWLTAHDVLIAVSGVLEILLGLLLLFSFSRRIAAWGIIALLIAVFPANVQMMQNYRAENNPALWLAVLRLPLQIVLIWWAYRYTKSLGRK